MQRRLSIRYLVAQPFFFNKYMMKLFTVITLVLYISVCQLDAVNSYSEEKLKKSNERNKSYLVGYVYDRDTEEPIPFANIYIKDNERGTMSDVDGRYRLDFSSEGTFQLRISSIGYAVSDIVVNVNGSGRQMNFGLTPQSIALENVTVTAQYIDKLGSDATIEKEALEYIQPTSIQDIFQLLPGGKLGSNNMQSRQLISSRQAGSDEVTSFGMGLSIDGVPMQNDGMRIQMSGFTGRGNVEKEGNISVNTGVDLRTISTDHIESISINRGIASAKEGNLSSGTIRVIPKQGQSSLRARIKFDPLNKLAYIGKGFLLSKTLGTLYLGADIVQSASKIDLPRGAYNRVTAQANWNNKVTWFGKQLDLNIRGSYITSFNNNKTDDIIETFDESYNTLYQRMMLSMKANIKLDWLFVDQLEFLASADYSNDILEYNKYVINQSVRPLQQSIVEGESEGEYLPRTYHTFYRIDNSPFNVYSQLTATKFGNINNNINYKLLYGATFNQTKNYGEGVVVDPKRPPYPSNSFIRPRSNKSIPAIANQAGYIEGKVRYKMGKHEMNTQLGLRETMMLNLPSSYKLKGRVLFEPRMQLSYTYDFGTENLNRSITLRAGYGIENKLPSADFLYPDKVYHDFVALNAYFNEPEKRLLITNTKIQDPTNHDIRENKNRKTEFGIDLDIKDYQVSLTAFYERMNGGIEYFTRYIPTSYTYYYELKHPVSTKPNKDDFYSMERRTFMALNTPTNSSKVIKKGIEYRISIPKIESIFTSFEINGAYYNTTYTNGVPVMYYPSMMQNNAPYPYVGIYDGYDKRHAEIFNTNFWMNTHIPKFKLIFTNFIQIVWIDKSRLSTDTDVYPDKYMDTYGEVHTLTPNMISSDNTFASLKRDFLSARYNELGKPISLRMNLKLTKEFNRWLKLSLFADNILQVSPKYKNNYKKTVRDWYSPFFGAELIINI